MTKKYTSADFLSGKIREKKLGFWKRLFTPMYEVNPDCQEVKIVWEEFSFEILKIEPRNGTLSIEIEYILKSGEEVKADRAVLYAKDKLTLFNQ